MKYHCVASAFHFWNYSPAKVFSAMTLILLKERSSWLRFFSWRSASLGTSLNEFRATFKRSRSLVRGFSKSPGRHLGDLGKPFCGLRMQVQCFQASWVQLGRGRGTRSNGFWQTLPFGALAPTSLLVAALKTDHAKTKSDAGRLCKKKPNVFHSLLFCPFKHLGIALLVNG